MKSQSSKLPALLKDIYKTLEDKKAEDIKVLDVSEQSSITDYLVLANGTSEPHLRALRVELEKVIDQSGVRIVGMDTELGSGWLVVDAFDIMVHVFTADNRKKYGLENLWKDAEEVSFGAAPVAPKKPVARKPTKAPAKKSAPVKRKAKPVAKKAKPAVKKKKPSK